LTLQINRKNAKTIKKNQELIFLGFLIVSACLACWGPGFGESFSFS